MVPFSKINLIYRIPQPDDILSAIEILILVGLSVRSIISFKLLQICTSRE